MAPPHTIDLGFTLGIMLDFQFELDVNGVTGTVTGATKPGPAIQLDYVQYKARVNGLGEFDFEVTDIITEAEVVDVANTPEIVRDALLGHVKGVADAATGPVLPADIAIDLEVEAPPFDPGSGPVPAQYRAAIVLQGASSNVRIKWDLFEDPSGVGAVGGLLQAGGDYQIEAGAIVTLASVPAPARASILERVLQP